MRRATFYGVLAIFALTLCAVAGAGMMGVGSLMGSSHISGSAPPPDGIATEASTILTTEAGSYLIIE